MHDNTWIHLRTRSPWSNDKPRISTLVHVKVNTYSITIITTSIPPSRKSVPDNCFVQKSTEKEPTNFFHVRTRELDLPRVDEGQGKENSTWRIPYSR